ncbi:MAG: TMEM175 family protein [Polyangiales bacterium]
MKQDSSLPQFFSPERTAAFSDAILAVVITILVLGIDIPPDSADTIAELLVLREKFVHQILLYFVTFWLVAMYWSQHNLLFASIARIDRTLVVLNMFFLLPVTLLPFVIQLMGTFRTEWRTVLLFGFTNLWAAFLFERMSAHVAARPESHKGAQTALIARRGRQGSRFFAFVMVLGVLIARLDVKLGSALFLVMPAVYFYSFIFDPPYLRLDPPSAK